MKTHATTADAHRLLLEGSLTLARAEANGIKVDVEYVDRKIEEVKQEIAQSEKRLKSDKVYKDWRRIFGQKTNIDSGDQLGKILFKEMGYKPTKFTEKTGRPSTKLEDLAKVDHPFVREYSRMAKLKKDLSTFLLGIKRETINGYFHPLFNLHTAQSYRSSSGKDKEDERGGRDLNFQNFPRREGDRAKLIRSAFISRGEDYALLEIDFKGIEVGISACYNHDPTLIKYIKDPTKDMHRDTACDLFFLTPEQVDKKTTRDVSKNGFVFPEFYGSVWFQCAPPIWEALEARQMKVAGTEILIRDHLKSKGITELGECDMSKEPKKGTFAYRVKEVEDLFWKKRFPVYTQWKKTFYYDYLDKGYFDYLTGFRSEGILRRNQVLNWPVQGSAFHCDLWTLIEMDRWLRKNKMKSLLLGEIHDSGIFDSYIKEVPYILEKVNHIVKEELPKAWPWIIVPLSVEAEISSLGGNWFEKKEIKI